MKKLIVLAVLLAVGGSAFGQISRYPSKNSMVTSNAVVLRSVWQRTYAAADTVITTGKFRDTVFSPWMEVPTGARYLIAFHADGKHAKLENGYKDTARANDSLALRLQVSASMYGIADTTLTIGSVIMGSADLDTTVSYVISPVRDTCLMRFPFVRSLVVMKDSSAAARPGLVGNTYSTSFNVFLRVQP